MSQKVPTLVSMTTTTREVRKVFGPVMSVNGVGGPECTQCRGNIYSPTKSVLEVWSSYLPTGQRTQLLRLRIRREGNPSEERRE